MWAMRIPLEGRPCHDNWFLVHRGHNSVFVHPLQESFANILILMPRALQG